MRNGLKQRTPIPRMRCAVGRRDGGGTSIIETPRAGTLDVSVAMEALTRALRKIRGGQYVAGRECGDDALLDAIDASFSDTTQRLLHLGDLIAEAERRNLDWEITEPQ